MQALTYVMHFELHCGTGWPGVDAFLNPTLGEVLGAPFRQLKGNCTSQHLEIS